MLFRIRHVTSYRYDRPVFPGEHHIRLRPRENGSLRLDDFRLTIYPRPVAVQTALDAEGNRVESAVFEGETQEFRVAAESSGETMGPPVASAVAPLSMDAPPSVPSDADGIVPEFLAAVSAEVDRENPRAFLHALSDRMHRSLLHVSRPTGLPLTPENLLHQGRGACRDFAVLFAECCRLRGIPARFVSGYLPADPGEHQHMHAWAEALLPGEGWLPFDPTRAEPPAGDHIAVAAAFDPAAAAPIEGIFTGFARTQMSVELKVTTTENQEAG